MTRAPAPAAESPTPDRLDGLSFPMQFRGTPIRVTLKDGGLTVVAHTEGFSRPIRVAVGDEVCELCAGDQHTFSLEHTASVGQSERRNGG